MTPFLVEGHGDSRCLLHSKRPWFKLRSVSSDGCIKHGRGRAVGFSVHRFRSADRARSAERSRDFSWTRGGHAVPGGQVLVQVPERHGGVSEAGRRGFKQPVKESQTRASFQYIGNQPFGNLIFQGFGIWLPTIGKRNQ